ncbi:MAG: malonyl-[acyl-carrier protein] O-methyltransferase BioC [Proteobacteria bacterium]|nr:MAG: malonyl-[acyl-carrier protein] O-methyltransferase BioC [Pseudomonadota bacterium]
MNGATSEPHLLDKRAVRAAFNRAAASYDAAAGLQREVGERLLERLDWIKFQPQQILELGCGTGHCTRILERRYRKGRLVALDLAEAMLERARRGGGWFHKTRYLCGDAERLPVADASADLIFSNLTLQWCNDLGATFREFRRVLRPGGVVLFSTFGPDTLYELRAAWAAVDERSHVNRFLDMHDVGDALLSAGLGDPVMDVDRIRIDYQNVRALMCDLKAIGAHNVTADRPPGLTGRRRMAAVEQAYEPLRREGLLPASYEVVYGHAWGLTGGGAVCSTGPADEVAISLDRLRGS